MIDVYIFQGFGLGSVCVSLVVESEDWVRVGLGNP